MQHLTAPRYAPRPKPTAIPTAAWNDQPLFCLQVNDEWVSHVLGVLTALDQQDTWIGTDDEIYAVRQQVNELMLALMTACPLPPVSFWDDATIPGNIADFDFGAIELGLQFQATVSGSVVGIRFYKAIGNWGPHSGHLFASDGTLLGTVEFCNETADGWQEARFPSPIAIDANTTYIAAYHAPSGNYAYDHHYFDAEFDQLPLVALADGDVTVGNGIYHEGDAGIFPDSSNSATNYWVDVIFQPGA